MKINIIYMNVHILLSNLFKKCKTIKFMNKNYSNNIRIINNNDIQNK